MKSWLILGEGSGLAALLSSNLVQTGARVVLFVEDSNENLEQFWADNQFLRDGTVGLVNCWPVSASLPTAGDANGLHWRFISLLQSAQKARIRFRQIEIIADQLADVSGEKIEQPQRAVIEGLARILPAEYPGVSVRVIDPGPFDANTSNEELAGSVQNEIVTAPMSGIALSIAYRGHTRWQQIWQSVPLEAVSQSRFRAQGCYVITGGLGGVGYLCARYLLEKYGARVALIGRTKLPDQHRWEDWLTEHGSANKTSQRIQRAKALQQASGELLLLSADVADETAMATAWAAIEGRFGRVHGVIHAAGLPGGARISAQHQQSLAEILRPKVKGSQVLACLLRNKPVDFLLFCSSISAVVPIAGASDYAAANAFQDRYAAWCRQHLGIPAVSVNFDAWQELGMAAEMKTAPEFEHVKEARLKTAMTTPEALEALERVLASSETHVLVSTIDFVQVLRAAESASSAPESMTQLEQQEDQDSQTFDESIELIETAAIVAIWRELLGVQSIASNDNFFELGGHSLLGTMVLARIRERFGVELTIRAIFEAPTPGELGLRVHEAKAMQPTEGPFVAVGEREEFEI